MAPGATHRRHSPASLLSLLGFSLLLRTISLRPQTLTQQRPLLQFQVPAPLSPLASGLLDRMG